MLALERNPGRRHGLKQVLGLLLAGGLAVCPLAQAAPYSYLTLLKQAETATGAPGVFAKLETMDPEAGTAFLEGKRGAFDMLRNMRSLSGDATGAAQASVWFDIADGLPAKHAAQGAGALESVTAEDAVEAIVRAAGDRQIVILNEAHHVPFHRVFAGKLARELRKAGFDYLAAETFAVGMPPHPAAVDTDMGFYIREPMYGEFVRGALRDGWSLVGYDAAPKLSDPSERERLREIGAVGNLVERIFKKNPKAKVFMYVGYGHARKQKEAKSDGWKSVATLLRETLGIDPLTIDQASMYGRGDARMDHPRYRAAMARFAPSKPVVLKGAAGTAPGYDIQVFHPDQTMHTAAGRPLWMERQAGLSPQAVPAGLLPASGRRLVKAFHAGDGPDAVPADMVMVEAGKPVPALMLPKGQFRFSYEE